MPYIWDISAWEEYEGWQQEDRKTLKRINQLLRDIARTKGDGVGKGELLKGGQGLRSVRIDKKNRLVFRIEGDDVYIISCKGHYSDR